MQFACSQKRLSVARSSKSYPKSNKNSKASDRSLANLAHGAGKKVNHTHLLRSLSGNNKKILDDPTHFIPEYMRKSKQKSSKKENSAGNRQKAEGKLDRPIAHKSVVDKPLVDIYKNMGKPTPPQGDNPTNVHHNPPTLPPSEPYSLTDVMSKLNALTGSVSKIDSMALDIDNIAEDIKAIRVLQDTTSKLSQDLSDTQDRMTKVESAVAELQDQESETLANQQLLAKELLDLKESVRQLQIPAQQQQQQQQNSVDKATFDFALQRMEAIQRQNNLIIEGIKEVQTDRDGGRIYSVYAQLRYFIRDTLRLPPMGLELAYRLGKPRSSSAPPRPIFVRFSSLGDRMEVWNARLRLNNHDDGRYLIKEDLPAQLRPIVAALSRVASIARKYPDKYRGVSVWDFMVYINGKGYTVDQLETLPNDLKPSFTSTPGNIRVVVFFGKDSRFCQSLQISVQDR